MYETYSYTVLQGLYLIENKTKIILIKDHKVNLLKINPNAIYMGQNC